MECCSIATVSSWKSGRGGGGGGRASRRQAKCPAVVRSLAHAILWGASTSVASPENARVFLPDKDNAVTHCVLSLRFSWPHPSRVPCLRLTWRNKASPLGLHMYSVPRGLNIKLYFLDSFIYRSIFHLCLCCGKRQDTEKKNGGDENWCW